MSLYISKPLYSISDLSDIERVERRKALLHFDTLSVYRATSSLLFSPYPVMNKGFLGFRYPTKSGYKFSIRYNDNIHSDTLVWIYSDIRKNQYGESKDGYRIRDPDEVSMARRCRIYAALAHLESLVD